MAKDQTPGRWQQEWDLSSVLSWTGVVLLTLSVLNRLRQEFYRLLWEQGDSGAVDLGVFSQAIDLWFVGVNVYEELDSAVYPPASYLMLWPFLGWLENSSARVLWAITTVIALGALIWMLIKESQVKALPHKILVGLLPLFYATRATIGNAQLGTHILPTLIAGLMLYRPFTYHWQREINATALVTWSMIKPSVSAPFFWVVLFGLSHKGIWSGIWVAFAYALLTLIASLFQQDNVISLMWAWLYQIYIKPHRT